MLQKFLRRTYKMKKLMAVLLAALMIISTLPIIASAAEAAEVTEADSFTVNAALTCSHPIRQHTTIHQQKAYPRQ